MILPKSLADRILATLPASGAGYTSIVISCAPVSREQLDAVIRQLEKSGRLERTLGRFFLRGKAEQVKEQMLPVTEVEQLVAPDTEICRCCRRPMPVESFVVRPRCTPIWRSRSCAECRDKKLKAMREAADAHSGG